MKNSIVNDPIVRRVECWPDHLYNNQKKKYKKNRHFKLLPSDVCLILMIIGILVMVWVIGYYIGRIVSTMSHMDSKVEAMTYEEFSYDVTLDEYGSTLADEIDAITPTPTPVPTVDVKPGLPLPDPKKADGTFKTYMDFRTIQCRNSPQYKLQQIACSDDKGFRRCEGFYLVALGTAYAKHIGEKFKISFSGGRTAYCMIGDVKADAHTNGGKQYIEENGNIVEFIIDKKVMSQKVISRGDISSLGFEGSVTKIVPIK